jgi:Tfp pilus assembly protein PilF
LVSNRDFRSVLYALVAALLLVVVAAVLLLRRGEAHPAPGSARYEQVTRAFYRGLAALEVGLLDDARQQFTEATALVADEPASWANLGLTQLRLGEVDAAAVPIERALALAPGNAELMLLLAKADGARGDSDAAVVRLRQAVALDTEGLRARFALADELQRVNSAEGDAEALDLLDQILERAPANLAVLLERARLAARRGDGERLERSRAAVAPLTAAWPAQALEQFAALERAASAGEFDQAARATTFLRNVLAPVPAYLESLMAVRTPAALIAEPFDRFLVLAAPTAQPAPADRSISFRAEPAGAEAGSALVVVAAYLDVEGGPTLFSADAAGVRRLDAVSGSWGFPGGAAVAAAPSASQVAALDWNHDFRTDIVLAGAGGVRLLTQGEDGAFVDETAHASAEAPVTGDLVGVWPADIEMDGDLDIVAAPRDGAPFVLRNNGNGTWRLVEPFDGVTEARGFSWADLDGDADADAAFVDEAGRVRVFVNRQAGVFTQAQEIAVTGVVAITAADLDANGTIDIVALDRVGALHRISWSGAGWRIAEVAAWPGLEAASPGTHRLIAADLDNNGAVDVIAAGAGASRVWLAGGDHALEPLEAVADGEFFAAVDREGDGRLDLAGSVGGRAAWFAAGGGTAGYHWKVLRPRAQQRAGDQRINAFGVGGEVGVRAGLLVQTQVMTGTPVHFGLGTHADIDVARIVWPNGIAQAEFGVGVDDAIVAEQRLKGSCPWVFAWDGSRMGFVTDFLWRSPLGLRINAQDTAGITQTEDWVKIAGERLVPRDGFYDIRITAELWETHFFDHVSLLVVDHPADSDVFVDERFAPSRPPALEVRAMRPVAPVTGAWDERGREVTDLVNARDGRYLAGFDRGAYQGIAEEHFVEFELGAPGERPSRPVLVATGWIYPTDSSINVAIGQGGHVQPSGLALEALGANGTWDVVDRDLGFPAGKNKTMLIDLSAVPQASRFRLRTNLEIYWDSLSLADEVPAALETTRLSAVDADLRYRGFSRTVSMRDEAPETPVYEQIANTTQRWRDLVGYYTRFGPVGTLLSAVDDRYVIMNAGDELRLRFPERPAPAPGRQRDFVLIGDGWEKDGDYNTGFSQTVLPLPSHADADYGTGAAPTALAEDPVFARHPGDWELFHTRFVTPDAFVRGLRSGRR